MGGTKVSFCTNVEQKNRVDFSGKLVMLYFGDFKMFGRNLLCNKYRRTIFPKNFKFNLFIRTNIAYSILLKIENLSPK